MQPTTRSVTLALSLAHPDEIWCRAQVIYAVQQCKEHDSTPVLDAFAQECRCRRDSCNQWASGKCKIGDAVHSAKHNNKTVKSMNPADYDPDDPDWLYKFWSDNCFGGIRIVTTALRRLMARSGLLNRDEWFFVMSRLMVEYPGYYRQLMTLPVDYKEVNGAILRPCLKNKIFEDGDSLVTPDYCWVGCKDHVDVQTNPKGCLGV